MTQIYIDRDDARHAVCGVDCGWRGVAGDTVQLVSDIQERVAAGETFPCGECPDCGCLAQYQVFEPVLPPASSPWGAIQHISEVAPGIWKISTASHGGMYLSDERMQCVPENLRETAYSKGNWFEEDCDWAIVAVTFPEVFPAETVDNAKRAFCHVQVYHSGAAS